MRLSDLRDKRVCTKDGQNLGVVHEVHCDGGLVTALMSGPGSFIERLTAKTKGRRIPWDCVLEVGPKRILVVPDPPQRKSSASRSRQGTRQPNARPSKR